VSFPEEVRAVGDLPEDGERFGLDAVDVEIARQAALLPVCADEVVRMSIGIASQLRGGRREAMDGEEVPPVRPRRRDLDSGVMKAFAVGGEQQVPAFTEGRESGPSRRGGRPAEPRNEQDRGSEDDCPEAAHACACVAS